MRIFFASTPAAMAGATTLIWSLLGSDDKPNTTEAGSTFKRSRISRADLIGESARTAHTMYSAISRPTGVTASWPSAMVPSSLLR